MPSPITQNIGSAISSTGSVQSSAGAVSRAASTAPTISQVAKAVKSSTEKVSSTGGDDRRRTARTEVRAEGSYSPKTVKPKAQRREDGSEEDASPDHPQAKLDTVA